MSIQSWAREFYPKPAKEIASKDGDDLSLVNHSIQKWKGLNKATLKKHNLVLSGQDICEQNKGEGMFTIDSDSCALCRVYEDENCRECPLNEYLGNPCSRTGTPPIITHPDRPAYPYDHFLDTGDPKPMQKALRETLKMLKKKKAGKKK